MNVIRPACRSRFTSADFEFILSVLGDDPGQRDGLARLFQDPEALDLILDQKKLFHALLEERSLLGISPQFYFYVLARQMLLRTGIDDRELTDYVGALLAEFAAERRTRGFADHGPREIVYLVDLLQEIRKADEPARFALAVRLGNHALVLSGLFSEYIEYRAQRRAAPSLAYYEEIGRGHFQAAQNHRLANQYDLEQVLGTLAEQFRLTRRALNELSDTLLIWDDPIGS